MKADVFQMKRRQRLLEKILKKAENGQERRQKTGARSVGSLVLGNFPAILSCCFILFSMDLHQLRQI
jgi:hypothetical protein